MEEEAVGHNDIRLKKYQNLLLFCKKIGRPKVEIIENDGILRFKRNKLIRYLHDKHHHDMNNMWELIENDMLDKNDLVKYYIDIGYTLCGFEEVWEKYIDKVLNNARKKRKEKGYIK